MKRDAQELISGFLDDSLSDSEHRELGEWIKANRENATCFAKEVMLHDRLQSEMSSSVELFSREHEVTAVSAPTQSTSGINGLRIMTTLAVCLILMIGIVGIYQWQTVPQNKVAIEQRRQPMATISQIVDVQWKENLSLERGDRMGPQTIEFQSGVVRLQFDDGVEVTLEGPADYELIAPGKTRLTQGLLTATVPPGAEGFTVETPTAEVVDRGTSFGIDLREDGSSRVSVFDGEVEVTVRDATEKRLLMEGETVRIGFEQQIEEVNFDPDRFEKVWPISSGIAGSTEAFRFVPPWPKRIRFVRSDDDIFVAAEGYAVDLTESLQVNISQPGDYELVDELTPLQLMSGVRVRSYVLHFSPTETLSRPHHAQRVSGSITFERPVRGLIVQHEELLASMRRFGGRAAGEAHHRRQLDLTGRSNGDRIALSEDRKTVMLDLISPGRNTDLVRVIVDAFD